MIKILQFGEGNFLRAFADAYFDTLNKESGKSEYEVHVVKPIAAGNLDKFTAQGNKYHTILRGVRDGKVTETVQEIGVLADVFSPYENQDKFYALARDREVRLVVSNTTESGIVFDENDSFEDFVHSTYPAKLTKWLYERYRAGLDGVYILPVELIDNNADALKRCVARYAEKWGLPKDFSMWNERENYYCNTLVDRIVSGYPRDEVTKAHLETLIGCKDELMSVGEPFGLWAIEKKGKIGTLIKEGLHNIEVVLTNDIGYYKKRKVRVLNGSHTNLVAVGLMLGKVTVYDCMQDGALLQFVDDTLREEIIPFVSENTAATSSFAESVKERFFNPYLNHQLSSIALNSISKWRARNLPSFKDYYIKHGKIPRHLTIGFSYLLAMYYERHGALQDEKEFLELFAKRTSVIEILQNCRMWGEDLSQYSNFAATVEGNIRKIQAGEVLL